MKNNSLKLRRLYKKGVFLCSGWLTQEDLDMVFIYDTGASDTEIHIRCLTSYGKSLADNPAALKGLWKDPVQP